MATKDKITGTALTAEDYLNNEGWVKLTETFFNLVDCDKDGVVTINDLVFDVKKYSHFHPDPKVIEGLRLAQIDFAAELGVKPGISVTKEEYVRNSASLAPREVAKVRSGEGSIFHKLFNRLFDVIDIDYDGSVSRERHHELITATEIWSSNFVGIVFDIIDTNKIGKLERKAISDFVYRSTLTLDIPGSTDAFVALKPVSKP